MEWIIWPDEPRQDAVLLGGKGAALWRLLQEHLPVPPVCCISSAAYRHWEQTGRQERLHDSLSRALEVALQRLRHLGNGATHFAVRSSAVAEDSATASFAGQLSTLLHVPAEQVAEAVIAVWRATDHATVYQEHRGAQLGDIAVLLQVMIPATVAGVLFTADPLSNSRERLVVNATWGLGEGVVSGKIAPDHWVIERVSGVLLEQHLGDKAHLVRPVAEGGTRTEATLPAQQHQWSLLPQQLATLRLLALQVEALFGTPQDIEWVYDGQQFWIVQSRPITTHEEAHRDGELDSPTESTTVWTAANIQEVIPGLLTPLGWSLLHEHLNHGLNATFRAAGAQGRETLPYLALFSNRPFLNATALRQAAAHSVGTSPEAIDEQYLGVPRPLTTPPVKLSWRLVVKYCRAAPRSFWLLWRTPLRLRQLEARLRPRLQAWRQGDRQRLSFQALCASVEQARVDNRALSAVHIATTSGASAFFETLRHWLQHWLGDDAAVLLPRLTTGLQQIASAAPGRELAAMAARIRQEPALQEVLRTPAAWETLHTSNNPMVKDFWARLSDFLLRYGHRGVMEFDVAVRTWEEDPESVLMLLRPLLPSRGAAPEEQAFTQRLTTTAAVMQCLSPLRRLFFRMILRQAQHYLIFRERSKSLLLEMNHALRLSLREVGRRLTVQGMLADPQDLYFLTWEELQPVLCAAAPASELPSLIRRRRQAWSRNQHRTLPETFQGRPQALLPTPLAESTRLLRGLPVCPGIVTGPARVILDPRQDTSLQPGEILVAPVTDAAWTPLFLVAAGVVVDIGGPLSHGAIVAREYGLPTVVNVKQATRLFRTGEQLTLNGATGEVWATDAARTS